MPLFANWKTPTPHKCPLHTLDRRPPLTFCSRVDAFGTPRAWTILSPSWRCLSIGELTHLYTSSRGSFAEFARIKSPRDSFSFFDVDTLVLSDRIFRVL